MITLDKLKQSVALTLTSYSTELGGIATTVAAVLYLLLPPFIEGTSTGWKSANIHSLTFAERAHEPKFAAYYGLNYAAVIGVVLAFSMKTQMVKDMLFLIGGLVIWVVIVARIAAATHATDNVHSIVQVPFYSTIPGVLTACMPATFNVVAAVKKIIVAKKNS